ncbi:MAG TPA: hypothetical protein VGS62_06860 [Streptosporangiaceae bacterium]|nr:hypothetical protein [Streptosporangiaceae bacterium]
MTTPTTPARIRWQDDPIGSISGHVGTHKPWVFQIFKPAPAEERWRLIAQLPGAFGRDARSADPDELKAEAERWLEEFVSSLGAIFPAALRAEIQQERTTQDENAAEHAEYGRNAQSDRCYTEVAILDWVLATMDRMEEGR